MTPCEDAEGQQQIRNQIALRKWISFETEIDHSTYCYHQGEWYRIGEQFVEQIRSQVADLLTHRADLHLPVWVPTGKQDDEHRYCELVAKQPGYVCLDRNFANTPFNRRLELGDLLGPGDQLIHVKWLSQATAASHLFVQAGSASWSLRAEPEALAQLRVNSGQRLDNLGLPPLASSIGVILPQAPVGVRDRPGRPSSIPGVTSTTPRSARPVRGVACGAVWSARVRCSPPDLP